MTPRGLVEYAKEDRRGLEDLLSDFITDLHKDKKSPGYMANYLKAVRSWLNYNEIRLVRRIKISKRDSTPTLEDERVPTKDELRQIISYASDRGKCSISLIAFSGLRPQSLGDLTGSDGLKMKDLPDLRIVGKQVTFESTPVRVVVRPSISKAGHKYFSFLIVEGCEHLKAYLERRLAEGEVFTLDSALISVKSGYEKTGFRSESRGSGHVTTKTLTKEIRDAMRPRFKWRPYVLRAYFDTQLMVAEIHGKLSHAYRQFFMGHKGDIEARYTTNKGRLPDEVIEDMRHSFTKCENYLSTRQVLEQSSIVKEAKKEALKSLAKNLLGIDLLEVKIARERELMRELEIDEEIELFESEIRKMREQDDPQRALRHLSNFIRLGSPV
jgi:integrase